MELQVLLNRWRQTLESTPATTELLDILVHTPELIFGGKGQLKFVREGNRVVISIQGVEHSRIAQNGGLQNPEDAGVIKRVKSKEDSLIVTGDSESLHIGWSNKNRLETVKVLRKMAPRIKIDSE